MRKLLLAVTALFVSPCFAILDLYIEEPLTVYEKPSASAKVISELAHGDVVVVSPNPYGGFKKVLVMFKGKRVPGYIVAKNLKFSYTRDRDDVTNEEVVEVKRERSFGISAGGNYNHQGSKSFQATFNTTTNTYDVASLESFAPLFELYLEIPLNPRWVVRPLLSFRNIKLKGTATFVNGVNPTTIPQAMVSENFLGVGALLKYYPSTEAAFWFGFSAELDHATSMTATVQDGTPTYQVISEALKDYYLVQVATGIDIDYGQFVLAPEFRLGAMANAKPFIINAELLISLGLKL